MDIGIDMTADVEKTSSLPYLSQFSIDFLAIFNWFLSNFQWMILRMHCLFPGIFKCFNATKNPRWWPNSRCHRWCISWQFVSKPKQEELNQPVFHILQLFNYIHLKFEKDSFMGRCFISWYKYYRLEHCCFGRVRLWDAVRPSSRYRQGGHTTWCRERRIP